MTPQEENCMHQYYKGKMTLTREEFLNILIKIREGGEAEVLKHYGFDPWDVVYEKSKELHTFKPIRNA